MPPALRWLHFGCCLPKVEFEARYWADYRTTARRLGPFAFSRATSF